MKRDLASKFKLLACVIYFHFHTPVHNMYKALLTATEQLNQTTHQKQKYSFCLLLLSKFKRLVNSFIGDGIILHQSDQTGYSGSVVDQTLRINLFDKIRTLSLRFSR